MAALVAAPAQAQVCGQRADMVDVLADRYHEAPINMGLATTGGVVEVFSTLDGSTWTIVVTWPDGKTCVLAIGEHWEERTAQGEPA